MSLRLDDLQAPPARRGFHSDLRRAAQAADRGAQRRHRIAAAVATAAALVVASAASVSAFRDAPETQPVDATFTCAVPDTGGVNRVDLIARVRGPGTNYGGVVLPNPAEAAFGAADIGPNMTELVVARETRNGFATGDALCRRTTATIPLVRGALPPLGVVRGTHGGTIQRECWLASTVTVRVHVVFGRGGKPSAAQLALRSGRKRRPVAFIDWTPTRAAAFASASCNQS
jgi:hypothetical protein